MLGKCREIVGVKVRLKGLIDMDIPKNIDVVKAGQANTLQFVITQCAMDFKRMLLDAGSDTDQYVSFFKAALQEVYSLGYRDGILVQQINTLEAAND